ncbi:DUF4975 domain-containing protein [Staphylococcus lentus]|uniref:glycoside hydrolase family 32 protein n=1 Tax=Mammaliicoccus lentus TaxID=42858 RepID=UPI0018847A0F|nr:glycoside hydrolase family 32 protein [Mammaliicoccus lentus]MBF0841192.1 DUF4975 domain-containing protein [Mammaliicoccus lentus]
MKHEIFYRPEGAYVGDVIPFQENGNVYLYYLLENRKDKNSGTPWSLLTTNDYAHFQDYNIAFSSGGIEEIDFNCYTGSVVTDEKGNHHLFYTGNNPKMIDENGKSQQFIMHAISYDDMNSWHRKYNCTFGPGIGYEKYDWRDPFVFKDENNVWRMLITARKNYGPERRRGVIAQYKSNNLYDWEESEIFWDPNRFVAMECPEVFKWGDWWYLIYSEFTDKFTTRYRMSKGLDGPWFAPEKDTIDGRAFYASKSTFLKGRRYFTGWISTKTNENDDGDWQWAGNIATLEAKQKDDGTLAFSLPSSLKNKFKEELPISIEKKVLNSWDSYKYILSKEEIPNTAYIKANINIGKNTKECGLLLRASEDGNENYAIRLEPNQSRMVFDRWPRKQTGNEQWQVSGDVPFYIELERPCNLQEGAHKIEILLEGSIAMIILDDEISLSTRVYNRQTGRIGYFSNDGKMTLTNLEVKTLKQ